MLTLVGRWDLNSRPPWHPSARYQAALLPRQAAHYRHCLETAALPSPLSTHPQDQEVIGISGNQVEDAITKIFQILAKPPKIRSKKSEAQDVTSVRRPVARFRPTGR